MIVAIILFFLCSSSFGLDSITNLPSGVSSPVWMQGSILTADQRYDTKGDLYRLEDLNAVELDVTNLKAIEPDIKKLELALNKFGQNDLGSTLHLGVIKVTTEPAINYSAPMFAHGINDHWMMGVGVPIIRYSNQLSFFHSGSNLKQLREQFYGVSDGINEAFDRLDQDLIAVAQQTLNEKGYKPIANRQQTFIGDLQLASFYLLYKDALFGLRWQTLLTLPTGPIDDPDDLGDLTAFGRTAWDNNLQSNFNLWNSLILALKGGFKWAIPDRTRMRVPVDANDSLPDKSRVTTVHRDLGDSFHLGTSLSYLFNNGIGVATGIIATWKDRDQYSGTLGGNYELLSRNTDSFALNTQIEWSYDSVSRYLAKKALIPVIFAFKISDNIRGRNVERLTQAEMTATFFY